MRRPALGVGGWFAAGCLVASALWSCSSGDTNPFGDSQREQGGSSGTGGTNTGGMSGSSSGTDSGSSGSGDTGGTSGASTGGESTGGMTTGGTTGDGGAAADSGNDSGGTASGGAGMGGTSGAGDAGMGGNAGTPATGGAGAGGAPTGGGGMGGGGAGTGGGGMSGSAGMPGGCEEDSDCGDEQYCKKEGCDSEKGECHELGPGCVGDDAEFEPVCGCDGITYWNTCVIEHDGINVRRAGECTDEDDRPTCTRAGGGDSCPSRSHAHCYRPVVMCGDPSPMSGFCWVLPTECPEDEPQTERYCGGTDGDARCIGLCEVIEAENSFRRDAPACD